MAWTPEQIPERAGHIAVVTGATSGLGLATARELARHGARVIMAARNPDKAIAARRKISADIPDADLEIRQLDLASLDSVRAFAHDIGADHPRIDLLINNAGVMGIPERRTPEGFEMQLCVNHLGHFVLTRHLLPVLLAARAARVVSVTSFARLTGRPLDPDNPHLRGRYAPWRAYNQSKLANLHFGVELQRRLDAAGLAIKSLIAHPGLSHTDLQARSVRETRGGLSQRFWHLVASAIGISPDRGAQSVLRAATDPAVRGGELYAPKWGAFGPPVRRPWLRAPDPRATRMLWEISERETGERFDIAEIVSKAT